MQLNEKETTTIQIPYSAIWVGNLRKSWQLVGHLWKLARPRPRPRPRPRAAVLFPSDLKRERKCIISRSGRLKTPYWLVQLAANKYRPFYLWFSMSQISSVLLNDQNIFARDDISSTRNPHCDRSCVLKESRKESLFNGCHNDIRSISLQWYACLAFFGRCLWLFRVYLANG